MKKFDYRRISKEDENPARRSDNTYIVIRTNRQDPPVARCANLKDAEMIVDALNRAG